MPTEDEFRRRIAEHLAIRPRDPMVAAALHGYLAALQEYGLVDHIKTSLSDLLPKVGAEQAILILADIDEIEERPARFIEEIESVRREAQAEARRWETEEAERRNSPYA